MTNNDRINSIIEVNDIMLQSRKLGLSDIHAIARIHREAFPNFFLTSLGLKFLTQFYKHVIAQDLCIAIGVFNASELVGFCIGTKKKAGFYKQVFASGFFDLFISSVFKLVFNPKKVQHLLRSLSAKETSDPQIMDSASILSICVSPKFKKKGIGKILLGLFEKDAFQSGDMVTLTTDADRNDDVNSFYSSNNYEVRGSFLQGSRRMNIYIKRKKR